MTVYKLWKFCKLHDPGAEHREEEASGIDANVMEIRISAVMKCGRSVMPHLMSKAIEDRWQRKRGFTVHC